VPFAPTALRQVFRDLGSQKLRTFLTMFGLVWGTTAISLLLSFGGGLHLQMQKNTAGLGRGVVITWPSLTSIPFEGLGKGRRIRLTERDVALLRRRAQRVDAVAAEYSRTLRLQNGSAVRAVSVSGVDVPFGEMRNLIPAEGGRFLNPLDETGRRRVMFVGTELAKQVWGEGADPVGRTVRLNGSPFLVVGLMQEKIQQSNYSGPDTYRAYIPSSTFQALTGDKYLDQFIYTAVDDEHTAEAIEEVAQILGARHRFAADDEEALKVWDTTQMMKFMNAFMVAFNIFLGVVGSLTLVVGGIGVSNIMNVVVEERTREIGIKMAIGARPRTVLGGIMLETLILIAAGGLIGIAITAGICAIFPSFGLTDFVGDPALSGNVAVLTVGLLGTIGLLAGWFPARAAARLDPVVAMKT
jgi:putative ABC transport system permease protein